MYHVKLMILKNLVGSQKRETGNESRMNFVMSRDFDGASGVRRWRTASSFVASWRDIVFVLPLIQELFDTNIM